MDREKAAEEAIAHEEQPTVSSVMHKCRLGDQVGLGGSGETLRIWLFLYFISRNANNGHHSLEELYYRANLLCFFLSIGPE